MEIHDLPVPDHEKQNLSNLISKIQTVLKDRDIEAKIDVVGGATSKPWPRKDIDIAVTFVGGDIENRSRYPDELTYAEAEFNLFRGIVEQAVSQLPQMSLGQIIEPSIDEEFESRSILKHNGSIAVNTDTVPIELVRHPLASNNE